MHSKAKLFFPTAFLTLMAAVPGQVQAAALGFSTSDATQVKARSAFIGGAIWAVGETATFHIEYGEGEAYNFKTPTVNVPLNEQKSWSGTITGLKPGTTYKYRVRAKGSAAATEEVGDFKSFATLALVPVGPVGTTLSEHGLLVVADGENRNGFGVEPTTGTTPFTFQWMKNGAKFGKASAVNILFVDPFKASDAGRWKCVVSNEVDSQTSEEISITAITPTKIPAKIVPEGGSFSATVVLTPAPADPVTYHWYRGANEEEVLAEEGIGTVATTPPNKLVVTNATAAAQADYYCKVTVGEVSTVVPMGEVAIGLKPEIIPIENQTFRVGEFIGSEVYVQNEPKSVKVAGLPAGLKYDAVHEIITGVPTKATPTLPEETPATVTITAKNAYGTSTSSFTITVLALDSGVVGTFNGTFTRHADSLHLGGKIKAVIASTGSISGTLTLGQAAYPIAGFVTPASSLSDTYVELTATLKARNSPDLTVYLKFDEDAMIGDVQGVANVSGQRAIWSKTSFVLGNELFAGTYNCHFKHIELPNPPANNVPNGYSIGSVVVTKEGLATLTGRVADGTTFTSASFVGPEGEIPVYASLYDGKGSFHGELLLDETGLHQNVTWNKDVTAGGRTYPGGFDAFEMLCFGKRYVKPTADNKIFGITADTTPSTVNARLRFQAINIQRDNDLDQPSLEFTITNSNAAVVPKFKATATPNPNPFSTTVKLDAATGNITGTFKVVDFDETTNKDVTRTGTYYGLWVPNSGNDIGFFTIQDMPMGDYTLKTSPIQSSMLKISPLPEAN